MSRIKKLVFLIGLTILIYGFFGRSAFWQVKQENPISVSNQTSNSYWALGVEQLSVPIYSGFSDICVAQDNSLLAISPYVLVSSEALASLGPDDYFVLQKREEIIEHTVKPNETLLGIAEKYGITLKTLLWANDLTKNSVIRPGQKLLILPVSGTMHLVKPGDTLSGIAKMYRADIDQIRTFNKISGDNIYIGDILVIPNGIMPKRLPETTYTTPLASSYFICPILPPCRITQGLHFCNAVDFSHKGISCGDPILAAAKGRVQKIGYQRMAGNYIRIIHPNGVVTVYGHLSKIIVAPGQEVSQGEIIGYMGHSGYTIPPGPAGCHLHFEVRGARNPFAQ